jgi:hypothetical protein
VEASRWENPKLALTQAARNPANAKPGPALRKKEEEKKEGRFVVRVLLAHVCHAYLLGMLDMYEYGVPVQVICVSGQ